MLIRNELGQIIGKEDYSYFFNDEDENYKDIKCHDVRFPTHKIETYPVTITYLKEA